MHQFILRHFGQDDPTQRSRFLSLACATTSCRIFPLSSAVVSSSPLLETGLPSASRANFSGASPAGFVFGLCGVGACTNHSPGHPGADQSANAAATCFHCFDRPVIPSYSHCAKLNLGAALI
ncbi:hypothetical protein ARMGADRAFT_94857 [Armillaria gallica]|uniref:Uncharacterized protein n=1 Tax=Armillaria gallica TaxID=47427 RepID=A0A2H3CT85_ARMGA|nr:hypothetical protein ARMGADRAFT_94857 [Armillaria gallica]